MSKAVPVLTVALQKSNGFLGTRLAAFLTANAAFELVPAEPQSNLPIDVLLLNGWGSVPSSSAGQPLAEIALSVTPLLHFLAGFSNAVPKHVVFFSSAGAVYANKNVGSCAGELSETAALSPNSAYGAGKIAAEAFLRAESIRLGFALTILRITNVYGPGQAIRAGFGIIPAIYQAMAAGSAMSLWPSSRQPRDYLFIDDFLSALSALLSAPAPRAAIQVFNLGSGSNASVPELMAIAEALVQNLFAQNVCEASVGAAQLRDAEIALPSAAAFQQTFNWRAQITLEAGIAKTFEYLANHQRIR